MTLANIRETARAEALGRLAIYREARAALHEDVRAAAIAGATQAEIARASGLSRQHVATIIRETR